jgi:glutathione S-transferase
MGEIIFHLALAADWAAALDAGEYRISTRGQALEDVGFIHCSRADQVAGVAGRYFTGAGPLVRLYIDRELVRPDVTDDAVPNGERFPHIHGPLNLDAVIATSATDPERAADGAWAAVSGELVVGVTGHRLVGERARVERATGGVAEVLAARAGAHGWRVVSALAEGADRIVASAALAAGAHLDAVLPLEPDDYRTDFAEPGSVAEFDALLARSDSVAVTGAWPDGSRERAYANAGAAMLGRCRVLVALWDGEPARGVGGTAEVVAAAQAGGIEIIVVPIRRSVAP